MVDRVTDHLPQLMESIQKDQTSLFQVLKTMPYVIRNQRKIAPQSGTAEKFGHLTQCLMFLYPGFPDLYKPILAELKGLQLLDDKAVIRCVQEAHFQLVTRRSTLLHGVLERPQSGYCGLFNLGNSCYLNSVLQALFMIESFRDECLKATPTAGQELLLELQILFAFLLKTDRSMVAPMRLYEVAPPPWFQRNQQQDCSEFLKHFLQKMHEQELHMRREKAQLEIIARANGSAVLPTIEVPEKAPTLIQRSFGGSIERCCTCRNCGHISRTAEPFNELLLPLPNTKQALAVPDLLKQMLSPELLNDLYECSKCPSKQAARLQTYVTSSPDTLILTLLRFQFDRQTQRRSKTLTEVQYPRVISLPVCAKPENNAPPEHRKYGLCGLIVHSGATSDSGHYYTYARPTIPRYNCDNGNPVNESDALADFFVDDWFLFNDERITRARFDALSSRSIHFSSDTAYVLVYRALDTCLAQAPRSELTGYLAQTVQSDNANFRNFLDTERELVQRGIEIECYYGNEDQICLH